MNNSYERRLGRRYQESQVSEVISSSHRPVFSRGRRLEAAVDVQQLPGNTLKAFDDEPFPFMIGYSAVGGPDLVG